MDLYTRQSDLVTDIVRDKAPLFEKASIDEFYIDVTGMDRFFGTYKWAGELRQHVIKESGLPVSFGLAINKMVAKVATGEVKPNGQVHIAGGEEMGFLAPLPVARIPMVGEVTAKFLSNMGVRIISALREIPREYLERLLGKQGGMLWQRARGIDNSPVIPFSERKSISSEQTFQQDTIDVRTMRSVLAGMTEKIAFRLRSEHKLTACVTVKIRYSDFQTVNRQVRIPYTSNDHELNRVVQDLFDKLYDRRLLLRLIGVRFSHLIHGGHQINLFEDTETQIKLYDAIDRIKSRYGASAVQRANTVLNTART